MNINVIIMEHLRDRSMASFARAKNLSYAMNLPLKRKVKISNIGCSNEFLLIYQMMLALYPKSNLAHNSCALIISQFDN